MGNILNPGTDEDLRPKSRDKPLGMICARYIFRGELRYTPAIQEDDGSYALAPNQTLYFYCDARSYRNYNAKITIRSQTRLFVEQNKQPSFQSGELLYPISYNMLHEEGKFTFADEIFVDVLVTADQARTTIGGTIKLKE